MAGLTLAFANPLLLAALVGLPLLWLLLRAIPPAPLKRRFPGVILLLGLQDEDAVSDRTPLWLLVLRMLALAALIVGCAGPLLKPKGADQASDAPVLIVLDGGWASGDSWAAHQQMLTGMLEEFTLAARPVAMIQLTTPEVPLFQPAGAWQSKIVGFAPQPWQPSPETFAPVIGALKGRGFDTYWLSDGLRWEGREDLLAALEREGTVQVFETGRGVVGVHAPNLKDGTIVVSATRSRATATQQETLEAHGRDLAGQDQVLAAVPLTFQAGDLTAEVGLNLPAELRARLTRFELAGHRSAATTVLSGDSLRRREVALIAGRADREGLELLSPLHYLRQALAPNADVIEGALIDMLPANPDVIVLADVATIAVAEEAALLDWLEGGGTLLRFAGPRLAASEVSRRTEHPLMPVRLRTGGRSVGGAMSWGEPKTLAPFPETSPFFGLPIPADIQVRSQVVAQPDPTLADRVIAELSDGTPLVSRKTVGQGQVVLFHVTANAEWSSLPLSGLFVQMLERLAVLRSVDEFTPEQLDDTIWQPLRVMDGQGRLQDGQALSGIAGEILTNRQFGQDLLPGLYQSMDRVVALNVMTSDQALPEMFWPSRITVRGVDVSVTRDLSGVFLSLALVLVIVDIVASLAVSGRLHRMGATAVMVIAAFMTPQDGRAQQDPSGSGEVSLAYVVTGDRNLDTLSNDGLRGLSETLFFRTSVEPESPVAVDLEMDELAFYPFIYWPISSTQPIPSKEAYARLNTYLRSGGMILFDTRDADVARFGSTSPNGRKLQRLAAPLDIPPLEVLPDDHVLTRTFYLLRDFPGRYNSHDVWVEAAPPDAEKIEGIPFRNLNDGVTPVVIGGNDWAAAWATDGRGNPLYPVGRGYAGEHQRELANRFGVNLVMHVLTGNYKSDQVHVPALLDRLGQ